MKALLVDIKLCVEQQKTVGAAPISISQRLILLHNNVDRVNQAGEVA
jgi:hypothetical protein